MVDVADRDAVEAWAAAVAAHHGVVHQIYNNAGIAFSRPVLESEYADYEQVLGVNLWGVIHGTKAFLPHVIASGDGHVTSISSVNGFFAQSRMSHYCASKFAVRGFSESLRVGDADARAPRGGDGRASRRREDQHRRRGAGRGPQARVRADRGGPAAPPDVQREDPAHAARAGRAHHRRRRRGRPTADPRRQRRPAGRRDRAAAAGAATRGSPWRSSGACAASRAGARRRSPSRSRRRGGSATTRR